MVGSQKNIESIVKAWNVLMFLGDESDVTLTQVARKLDIPKTSTLRILGTLVNLGLVSHNPDNKTYNIDYRVLGLSYRILRRSVLRKQASPYLYELANSTELIACLGVLSGPTAVTIDKVSLHAPFNARQDEIGATVPVHASSVGKIILAHQTEEELDQFLSEYQLTKYTSKTISDLDSFMRELESVREKGYAINEREWHDDVVSIAMPVYNYAGQVIAGVALSWETTVHGAATTTSPFTENHIRALTRAANQISFSCGYHSDEMILGSAVWKASGDGK